MMEGWKNACHSRMLLTGISVSGIMEKRMSFRMLLSGISVKIK